MSEKASKKVKIDSEETENILVVDPTDYRKTQKLKSIQKAKDHYKDFTLKPVKTWENLSRVHDDTNLAYRVERQKALANYGSELLPLIEEGIEKGAISECDMKIDTRPAVAKFLNKEEIDLREIIDRRGAVKANNEIQKPASEFLDRAYRQFERLERKLGMGLDIEEQNEPAEI